ncbi:MAG: small metal-binding protein SmbP [Nitrospiria bacterium]
MRFVKGMMTAVLVATVLLLSVLTAHTGSPDVKAAQMHVQSMWEEGEQMMSHGDQGHLELMISHAEAMREHAKAAMGVAPLNDMHGIEVMERLKEAIGHLDEAIVHARRGHGDAAMAHAKKAMAHAREGAKHAKGM